MKRKIKRGLCGSASGKTLFPTMIMENMVLCVFLNVGFSVFRELIRLNMKFWTKKKTLSHLFRMYSWIEVARRKLRVHRIHLTSLFPTFPIFLNRIISLVGFFCFSFFLLLWFQTDHRNINISKWFVIKNEQYFLI